MAGSEKRRTPVEGTPDELALSIAPAMDYRERKRLEDEINRGVPNVGIYKVDGEAYERENRSPIFKGAVAGFGLATNVALAYVGVDLYSIFPRSPRRPTTDGDELVMVLIMAGGTVLGAVAGWLYRKFVPTRRKPKGASAAAANGNTGQLTDSQ